MWGCMLVTIAPARMLPERPPSPSARRMNALLLKRGYQREVDLKYVVETDGEHTESAWARRLPDALRFLIPR